MNMQSVRILDGPLQGVDYDIVDELDTLIELNCAAGPLVYQFKTSDAGETVLRYVGPGRLDGVHGSSRS